MDFNYTPEEEAFRAELAAWLDAHVPQDWPTGDDVDYQDPTYGERLIEWQRTLGKDGWAAISWPRAYGGREASILEQAIYSEEMAKRNAPQQINVIGLGMCGPTIMTWGTEDQKKKYIPKLLSGEHIWVQGFSEPNAGSDVASLRTTAIRDGDEYVLNGQKVWTTYAQFADYVLLLVRTDPDAPKKHKGLSMFIVDLKLPGVSVRPLQQITGDAEFNEIFFDDVRVSKDCLVGPEGEGWKVAITTLMFERVNISGYVMAQRQLEGCLALAQKTTRFGRQVSKDSKIRQKLAKCATELQALHLNELRAMSKRAKGDVPGPEGSIAKLMQSRLAQEIAALSQEVQGPHSQLMPGSAFALEDGAWQRPFLRAQASTIAGGTTAIMRNIIAERVLGLPKD